MRRLPYELCDVFTDRPLTGNALAVFTEASGVDDATLQALAREMNLSESTFALPPSDAGADVRIRIFTPATELPFAGHPVLGSGFVHAARLGRDVVRLETKRGVATVELTRDSSGDSFGWMTQPLPSLEPFANGAALLEALGVARAAGVEPPVELWDNGPRHVFVELPEPSDVAALRPDFFRLAALGNLAITTYARDGERWKNRVFAPGEGIAEDPATGGAAGPFAVHLVRRGHVRFGDEVVIDQGAEIGRPSRLHARALGSGDRPERVLVGGHVVAVGRGEITLP